MLSTAIRHPAVFHAVRDLDALMNSVLGTESPGFITPAAVRRHASVDGARLAMPIALREDAQNIYLDADLPGVDINDVDITLDRGTLTLRATRQLPVANGQELRHTERFEGEMVRAITLGRSIDADRVSAEMRSGVLTVTLPKVIDQTGRKIAVKSISGS
jgi:HSP20 family protein